MDALEILGLALVLIGAVVAVLVFGGIIATIIHGIRRRLLGTLLLEHIHALTRLGLPLSRALSFCTGRMSAGSRRDIREVDDAISEGGMLVGDALARVPVRRGLSILPPARLVTPAEAETLRVGEMTGNLAEATRLVLKERGRFSELRNWLIAVCFYAGALLCITAGILTGIMTFVVPKFKKMFDELDVELPVMTRMLVAASDRVANAWYLILPVVVVGVLVAAVVRPRHFRPLMRRRGAPELFQRLVFYTPSGLFFLRKGALAEFCGQLAMLLRIGTPAPRALAVLADGTLDPWFRDRIRDAAERCEMGEDLATALDRAAVDRRAAWFARSTTGQEALADALLRLADDYRSRTGYVTSVIARIIPPLVVVALGCVVGFVVVALFLPLVKLSNSIGG